MNYLQKKKKAMLNYVSGITPTETVQITTKTASSSSAIITVTYNGVSTDYGYATLLNKPIIVGNVIVEYSLRDGNGKWWVYAYGDVAFNGTTYHAGNNIANWTYLTSVDYEFVGTVQDRPIGSTQVFVSYGASRTTWLMVIDNNNNVIYDNDYNTYLDTTVARNLVDITYNVTDGWKFTANTPLKFNGATYQVGEVVERLPFMNDYDLRTFEPI